MQVITFIQLPAMAAFRITLMGSSINFQDDYETDEEEVAARWNNGLAAQLGNGGVILVLVETPTGFAMFVYDGIKLLEQNAYQTVWLVDFLAFDDRLSAINPITGVSAELATMINKHIDPGQKIAVEKEVYKKVIQTNLNISCLCGGTVEELIWGLKIQMPYLLKPNENLELDKEALFPMSNGMKMLLNSHGFIFEPDQMVTRHVIKLAGVVRECDRCVNKHESSLRSAAEHLKKISRIDTEDWDLMKLATALKIICYPNENVAAPRSVFSKRDLVKLRKDAPKYEDKILKRPLLIIYDEINSARDARYTVVCMLSRLLNQAERAAGQSKRQIPSRAPVDALKRYTCISCHHTSQDE
ncbi:hypothetical protein QOZ80_6BG0466360 [Eleusine coracana subsp. coracana]|nr:hypothetical protein QOZ80_6BG0466360 [Eleusine coracana subsp. coracana]